MSPPPGPPCQTAPPAIARLASAWAAAPHPLQTDQPSDPLQSESAADNSHHIGHHESAAPSRPCGPSNLSECKSGPDQLYPAAHPARSSPVAVPCMFYPTVPAEPHPDIRKDKAPAAPPDWRSDGNSPQPAQTFDTETRADPAQMRRSGQEMAQLATGAF